MRNHIRIMLMGINQRSVREIPSLCIMAFKVVRGTPRRAAAALLPPPVSRKTRMICLRIMSASMPPAASAASARSCAQGSTEPGDPAKGSLTVQ